MRVLFLFLDGVGLGEADPTRNPLVRARMPTLTGLLEGRRLAGEAAPFEGELATLAALDACLGVTGLPQSATGQAALLTGLNAPSLVGQHYGPKPNPAVAQIVQNGNLFERVVRSGGKAALLNAYPPRYFEAIASGQRLLSAIPLAASSAGLPLKTMEDLSHGQALSADFTGQGWRTHLGLQDTPVLSEEAAGRRLAELSSQLDLAFFEYWLSDYAGHGQEMEPAIALLEAFDRVLFGLLETWDTRRGIILLTSDHGNLEDLSTRRHTRNPVPALTIGSHEARQLFHQGLTDLTGVAPAITRTLNV